MHQDGSGSVIGVHRCLNGLQVYYGRRGNTPGPPAGGLACLMATQRRAAEMDYFSNRVF